jgi:hypothetical protein
MSTRHTLIDDAVAAAEPAPPHVTAGKQPHHELADEALQDLRLRIRAVSASGQPKKTRMNLLPGSVVTPTALSPSRGSA